MRGKTARAILPVPFVRNLERTIDLKGRRNSTGDRNVGNSTLAFRLAVLRCVFGDLYHLGYKLPMPDSLRENHVKALVSYWITEGLSAATIQNRLTHLRQFCKWIGKPGMVRSTESYVDDTTRHMVRRSGIAKENLSWEGKGIVALEVIKQAQLQDKWTALYLQLIHAFGLRLREAIYLRPIVDVSEDGTLLSVRDGTKGGRHRMLRIETDYQRETLSLAAQMSQSKNKRIIPAHRTLEQAYHRTRYWMRKLGLTKGGLGVTAHGLRHQYAQNRYVKLVGVHTPIQGGDPALIDRDTHIHACYDVMQHLGHSRVDIAATYYGSHGHKLRGKNNLGMPWEREARQAQTASVAPNYGVSSSNTTKVQYTFVLKVEPATQLTILSDSSEAEEA